MRICKYISSQLDRYIAGRYDNLCLQMDGSLPIWWYGKDVDERRQMLKEWKAMDTAFNIATYRYNWVSIRDIIIPYTCT